MLSISFSGAFSVKACDKPCKTCSLYHNYMKFRIGALSPSKGGLSPPFPTGDWVVVTIVIADFLLGFGTGTPFLNGSQTKTKYSFQ